MLGLCCCCRVQICAIVIYLLSFWPCQHLTYYCPQCIYCKKRKALFDLDRFSDRHRRSRILFDKFKDQVRPLELLQSTVFPASIYFYFLPSPSTARTRSGALSQKHLTGQFIVTYLWPTITSSDDNRRLNMTQTRTGQTVDKHETKMVTAPPTLNPAVGCVGRVKSATVIASPKPSRWAQTWTLP